MKKAIICTLVLMLLFIGTAYAYETPEISVTDVTGDVITVSGVAESDVLPVSLVILNPGYTLDSLSDGSYTSQTEAIQTFKAVYPVNGKFSFEVPMKDTTPEGEGGGLYTVYITEGETGYDPISYRFYFQDVKTDVIKDLNLSSDITTDKVADAYEKYGLEDYDLYKNGNTSEIASALELIKADSKNDKYAEDTAAFDVILKKAALIAAYNASKTDILVDKDGYLKYADIMGITELSQWEDYTSSLNKKGVEAFNKDLIAQDYESIEKINEKFRELIAYYGIINYKEGGFGHFDYFFGEYDDIYDKYDFKISKIKPSNRNKIYKATLDTTTTDIADLAEDFNDLIDEYQSESSGSGGGGGGGSRGSGIAVAPTVEPGSYIEPEIKFDDLGSAQWAHTAVMYLAEKGIVSGKAKNIFAPNDLVTRGEFLKMLTAALSITSPSEDAGFADTDGHWSEKYVAAAVNAGIAKGMTDTAFEPDTTITREMGATFVKRALDYKTVVCEADPSEFADHADISEYAREAVYSLKRAGIMSGVGNNSFNPKGNMTRAEAAKTIYSLIIYSEEVGQ